MDFLARVFGHSPRSANVAKERLQLVLAHDRTNISAETLAALKDEIIAIISRHIEIDRENVEVSFARTDRTQRLVANIPLASSRKPRK
jgi:cell division topological specificity factor